MHQRTWLSLLSLPLVAAFTYPVVFQRIKEVPRSESRPVSQDPLAGLSDIQDVLALIRDNYVDSPDLEKVINGGIQGVLERAHPLNSYLTAEDLHLVDPGPAGIGIRVIKSQIYAKVVAVVAGSPAAKAGFQVGDVVRKLDGNSIGPLSTWSLERKLRGPEGSELSLLRYAVANGDLKKITLKRELIQAPAITVRKDPKATLVTLADLGPGRSEALKAVLAGLDHHLPLILDLRQCSGGTLAEAALAAGLFVGPGPLVTIQETGKADTALAVVSAPVPSFAKVAILQGPGDLGPGEAFAAALKRAGVPTFGERTGGLGVERTRFLLKQGGAVELVNKRWIGAGGEYLGSGGDKPETAKPAPAPAADPKTKAAPKAPLSYGVVPEHPLKGLKPDEDPLPRILELLEPKTAVSALGPVAPKSTSREVFRVSSRRDLSGPAQEVA